MFFAKLEAAALKIAFDERIINSIKLWRELRKKRMKMIGYDEVSFVINKMTEGKLLKNIAHHDGELYYAITKDGDEKFKEQKAARRRVK